MRPKYKDKRTKKFASGGRVKEFQAFAKQAYMRLEILDAAPSKESLMMLPKMLGGDRKSQYSICISHLNLYQNHCTPCITKLLLCEWFL